MIQEKQFTKNTHVSVFDNGPEEPNLCALSGYDDCETCYFRISTLKRITEGVKRLKQEA